MVYRLGFGNKWCLGFRSLMKGRSYNGFGFSVTGLCSRVVRK